MAKYDPSLKKLPPRLCAIWGRLDATYQEINLRLLEEDAESTEYSIFRHDFGAARTKIIVATNLDWKENLTVLEDAEKLLDETKLEITALDEKIADEFEKLKKEAEKAGKKLEIVEIEAKLPKTDLIKSNQLEARLDIIVAYKQTSLGLLGILDSFILDCDALKGSARQYPQSAGVLMLLFDEFATEVSSIVNGAKALEQKGGKPSSQDHHVRA